MVRDYHSLCVSLVNPCPFCNWDWRHDRLKCRHERGRKSGDLEHGHLEGSLEIRYYQSAGKYILLFWTFILQRIVAEKIPNIRITFET
ncbi:hypothetical protein PMAYCL1PPCAC_01085 [Pristionchus mayeri]|uniref:Uncharacterized protein n=1 Tax=Pristionchus mayeri TaxID=1317129 RepID=A0AAN5C4Z4_9BILA|nr:hypothetical protein PMAYCL1PPCAC_01085 [Pristionchus mayeri]